MSRADEDDLHRSLARFAITTNDTSEVEKEVLNNPFPAIQDLARQVRIHNNKISELEVQSKQSWVQKHPYITQFLVATVSLIVGGIVLSVWQRWFPSG
ncbi:MAG: hypothetical protein ACR2PW_02830 [Gammaproteobacteria bacterium]